MRRFRIIGFTQVYNEIRKENLERFVKYFLPLIDEWVVFDDGSTDGSYEYISNFTPYIIRSAKNKFANEIEHRHQLLELALRLNPDFVLWLDVDEVLTFDKLGLQKLCQECVDNAFQAISLHEWNIWRSNCWKRIDNLYNDGWFVRLWRIIPGIHFARGVSGLHQQGFPITIQNIGRSNAGAVLHYGFASQRNLAFKYLVYRRNSQTGLLLRRLIDEENLSLVKIPPENFPKGLVMQNDTPPKTLNFEDALANVESLRAEVFKPSISIICLIYKSTDWLQFVYDQVLKWVDLEQNEFFFVANDANEEVLHYLQTRYIRHVIFNNTPEQKQEWFINNVYRAFNYGAKIAKGDYLIFINSDMAFSPNWLESLFVNLNAKNCIASRLIESGKMESGKYGLSRNFGRSFEEYQEPAFIDYAENISRSEVKDGGLYMPLLIRRNDFWQVGGYPEGNITIDSDIFEPKIAIKGQSGIAGDEVLMRKLASVGIKHQTDFNSIVYHFQAGEMNSQNEDKTSNIFPPILICNDLLTGSIGERTMWDFLLDGLPNIKGIDSKLLVDLEDFSHNAHKYIYKNYPQTQIVIQNASFIDLVYPEAFTCVYLQDDLRRMGCISQQQEKNLQKANLIVSNSEFTASSYPEYDVQIIPIGVDDKLFRPLDKVSMRQKHNINHQKVGIFVGEFNEVKGWSKIVPIIYDRTDIFWILVSKKEEDFIADNIKVYNRIDQSLLAELLNCADFFIIASPVETQCLAAIEACLCDVPVVMPKVGIFADWEDSECMQAGVFGDDLTGGINKVLDGNFQPRTLMLKKGLTVVRMIESWHQLLTEVHLNLNNRIQYQLSAYSSADQIQKILKNTIGYVNFYLGEIQYLLIHKMYGRSYQYALSKSRKIKLTLRNILPTKVYNYLRDKWRHLK